MRDYSYAVETLATSRSWQVFVRDSYLELKADLLAFVLAVQISPTPALATAVARRIGDVFQHRVSCLGAGPALDR